MDNDHEQLIDLDARPADAAARGDRLGDWLAEKGWIGTLHPETYWAEPTERTWTMGAHAKKLFPLLDKADLAITAGDGIWMTDGEPQAPTCPQCDTTFDFDDYIDELEGWAETGDEPTATCENCGFTAPFGDWKVDDSPLGGSIAILVELGSPHVSAHEFAEVLVAELRKDGGRWAHTSRHI